MATLKQINERSEFLGKVTKSNDNAIQDHLLSIAEHISLHGDVTCADYFIKQLGEGLRKNPIRQWLIDLGGCTWNAEKKSFGKRKDWKFDSMLARETHWTKLSPEKEFVPVDSLALVKSLLSKLTKAMNDQSEDAKKNKIDKAHVRMLTAIVNGEDVSIRRRESSDVVDAEFTVVKDEPTHKGEHDEPVKQSSKETLLLEHDVKAINPIIKSTKARRNPGKKAA